MVAAQQVVAGRVVVVVALMVAATKETLDERPGLFRRVNQLDAVISTKKNTIVGQNAFKKHVHCMHAPTESGCSNNVAESPAAPLAGNSKGQ